jgi:hypothetical protein
LGISGLLKPLRVGWIRGMLDFIVVVSYSDD